MCDLLVSHPQFNFAPNMVNLLVPYLNSRDDGDRATAKSAVQGGKINSMKSLGQFSGNCLVDLLDFPGHF